MKEEFFFYIDIYHIYVGLGSLWDSDEANKSKEFVSISTIGNSLRFWTVFSAIYWKTLNQILREVMSLTSTPHLRSELQSKIYIIKNVSLAFILMHSGISYGV